MAQDVAQTNPVKTMREIMGMEPAFFTVPVESPEVVKPVKKVLPPPPLPVGQGLVPEVLQESKVELQEVPVVVQDPMTVGEFGSPLSRFFSRDFVRYPLIFLVALGAFYVILNFRAVSAQIGSWLSNPGKKEQVAIQQVTPDYNQWLKKYYVYVNDPKILDPKSDPDHDGLTNLEEFYLGTNPLKSDTDGDGYTDGQDVMNGYNPLYEGRLTTTEQKIIADHVDKDALRSRLALQSLVRVAGETTPAIGGDFQLDPSKPGNISIPKIGVDAPITWSREFSQMENDLKSGTAHHPDTPYPGERGTASIHGHSSGNPWDGDYQTVFTKLNFLEPGDEVFVTVYNYEGTVRRYRYVVRSEKVYPKNNQEQFEQRDGYFLNLSTSWPVGTAHERYVVTTELVGI